MYSTTVATVSLHSFTGLALLHDLRFFVYALLYIPVYSFQYDGDDLAIDK